MAIEIHPQVEQEPMRPQLGGVTTGVQPMQDATGQSLRAVGAGAQDFGRAFTVMADRYQDHIDRAQSHRMRNLYDAEVDRERWAPGSGFLTTTGLAANPARRKQHEERLTAQRRKIAALGQNDAQRLAFTEFADRADAETSVRADLHMVRQARIYEAGETRTAVERGLERAASFAGTEEGEVTRTMAMRDLDRWAELEGLGPEGRAAEIQKANDAYHGMVLDRMMVAGQGPAAPAYLAKHKGEMSTPAVTKAMEEIQRRNNATLATARDTAAWATASKLAESGQPLTAQRAELDRIVRAGDMDGETAAKAWSFARGFDEEKYQDVQRARSAMTQTLEQSFAKNPSLEVDTLPAATLQQVDGLAMRGDAVRIHKNVRLNRLADLMGDDDAISLRLSRDIRSNKEGEEFIGILESKRDEIKRNPDLAKSAAGQEKIRRYEARIAEVTLLLDALATRPRIFTTTDAASPSAPTDPNAPPQPLDLNKIMEDFKRSLYPGSGR